MASGAYETSFLSGNACPPDGLPVRATNARPKKHQSGHGALRVAATAWFATAVSGQLLFVAYLAGFYGRTAARGNPGAWNEVLIRGHVPGDAVGNGVVATHLVFAALIIIAGALQLVPGARQRLPRFHRWNGRFYLLSAGTLSIGGSVMTWGGRGPGDVVQHLAITLNAVLILAFAGMALHWAMHRRFDAHRQWAWRLYIAVSGVWFFRIGLSLWIMLNQRPAGFDPDTFTGPALNVIAFAQYLLPLLVLEGYFRAQRSDGVTGRIAMAAVLSAATLLTAAGIFAAAMMLWLPHL